jgi:hypothetical protein
MKTEAEIKKRIQEIEADSRYPHEAKDCAKVVINAPLALIQTDMKAEIRALKWVLREGGI